MKTLTLSGARTAWTAAGFTGNFTPNGHNSDVVIEQFTTPSSSPGQCIAPTSTVDVTYGPAPTPAPTCAPVPNLVGMLLPNARAAWTAAGFTGSFTPASPIGDTQNVASQVTTPSSNVGQCIAFASTITVTPQPLPTPTPTPAPCKVPSFIGTASNKAQKTWSDAGFTTTVIFQQTGQWTVRSQDRVGGSFIACNSTVTLGP
jgi:hypothetical protein